MSDKNKSVSVNVTENESVLVVNDEISNMLASAFGLQDDIENESKFNRSFVFDAVQSQLKVLCARQISQWDRVVDKASKLHPTKTREQLTQELLVSKRAQHLHKMAQAANDLRKRL